MVTETQNASEKRLRGYRISLDIEARKSIYTLLFLLLITAVGMVFALQGWKSRKPAQDMLVYFRSVEALLQKGEQPPYGDISSYGSFSPPGTTWLMIPGVLIFKDPRLYEKAGSALLHFGTLLGIYLLARSIFGRKSGILAVILYGLSSLGLSFAGSLWPIGHPFFFVWMAYFACLWASKREAKYLAAGLLVYGAGMYVDMAITPAAGMFPVIWLLYHPPIFSWRMLLSGALVLALWFPYLHFESGRNYVDLESQFMRRNIMPVNYKVSWCNPNLALLNVNEPAGQVIPQTGSQSHPSSQISIGQRLLNRLLTRAHAVRDGLLSNLMENTPSAWLSLALLLILLAGSALIGISGLKLSQAGRIIEKQSFIKRLGLRALPAGQIREQIKAYTFLICLFIPWAILLVVAEPGRSERFLWLWPLQVILLAAAVTNLLAVGSRANWIPWIGSAVLLVAIVPAAILPIAKSWLQSGWSGTDAEEVQVAGLIAQRIHAQGKEQASIGYDLYIYPFMASYHTIDPNYKVGAEIDYLFRHLDGITNTDSCGEGISPKDDYRIVQTQLEQAEDAPSYYFASPYKNGFRQIGQIGRYQIFERSGGLSIAIAAGQT